MPSQQGHWGGTPRPPLRISATGTWKNLEEGNGRWANPVHGAGSTVARAAEELNILAANMSYSSTAMSMSLKGDITFANPSGDFDVYILFNWSGGFEQRWRALNKNQNSLSQFQYLEDDSNTQTFGTWFTGTGEINGDINFAMRATATAVNAAVDGTADTEAAKTNMGAFSGADPGFYIGGGDTFLGGNIGQFRQWNVDLGDSGIATAST